VAKENISFAAQVQAEAETIKVADARLQLSELVATVKDAEKVLKAATSRSQELDGIDISVNAWAQVLDAISQDAEAMLKQGLLEREAEGEDLTEDPWLIGIAGQLGLLARKMSETQLNA
jgi:hypothetical protein